MELCPICHSPINVTDNQKEELRSRGVYTWTDDPIVTNQGLAGDQFKGLVFFNWRHIKEIQDARTAQETTSQITNKTTFSEISAIIDLKKEHINELRISTEKILNKLTESNPTINLSRYFNYDRDGTYHGTWQYDEKITDKIEWTDVDRTTGHPSLPSEVTDIRAIHIEELRCQIPLTTEAEQEEPPFSGIYIVPSDFMFNMRTVNSRKPIEFKVYSEGFIVPEAQVRINDTSIAEIIFDFNERYVSPISVGNTTLFASYGIELEYQAHSQIRVYDYINYSGTMRISTRPIIFYGSGIGEDGSTLNWTIDSGRISGNWDVPFSNIPLHSGCSWPMFAINPSNPNEYPYPYQLSQADSITPPTILSGYYSWAHRRYYTDDDYSRVYPINGYKMSGSVNSGEYGTFEWKFIDSNEDGIKDIWRLHLTLDRFVWSWGFGFSK